MLSAAPTIFQRPRPPKKWASKENPAKLASEGVLVSSFIIFFYTLCSSDSEGLQSIPTMSAPVSPPSSINNTTPSQAPSPSPLRYCRKYIRRRDMSGWNESKVEELERKLEEMLCKQKTTNAEISRLTKALVCNIDSNLMPHQLPFL
jgi:hypothetical protein